MRDPRYGHSGQYGRRLHRLLDLRSALIENISYKTHKHNLIRQSFHYTLCRPLLPNSLHSQSNVIPALRRPMASLFTLFPRRAHLSESQPPLKLCCFVHSNYLDCHFTTHHSIQTSLNHSSATQGLIF